MDAKIKSNKELKDIVMANPDLRERAEAEKWSISYSKKTDMVHMGANFPKGTFYYPLNDTGVLLRVDSSKKIYGFAVENVRDFMKKYPQMAFPLSFVVYPYRTYFIKLPLYFIVYQTTKSFSNLKSVFAISDFIAGKAAYIK